MVVGSLLQRIAGFASTWQLASFQRYRALSANSLIMYTFRVVLGVPG